MDAKKLYSQLSFHHGEIRKICGILFTHFKDETDKLIEVGDFEGCFTLLDTWEPDGSEVHKYLLFNDIAKKESIEKGVEPRDYHKRYKK